MFKFRGTDFRGQAIIAELNFAERAKKRENKFFNEGGISAKST